jgi:hypothetical protein
MLYCLYKWDISYNLYDHKNKIYKNLINITKTTHNCTKYRGH